MVKTRLLAVGLICSFATAGWASTSSPSLVATPPQPMWSELTVQQKSILAPLSNDWDSLAYYRQKKWLSIAARFPDMKPEEQRRIQGQMQEWGKLTPEQRQLARENFKTANQLPLEQKQELKMKWEEYSNLPEDEKEKLKQQATSNLIPKPGRPATTPPLFPVTGNVESPNTPAVSRALPVNTPATAAATVPAVTRSANETPSKP